MAKSGRIITFYSYKGGTGRSMALSNVAWVLATNGFDVLLIDWDLEAPGLHRYLRAFLVDPELASTPGLIDYVWDCAKVSMTPASEGRSSGFPSLEDYAVGLDWDFEHGSISFIPAGRQDENYAQRVNTFNWDNFYERLGGGKLLDAERKRLCESYDYVLIDSRTGVSDTSSICTVQMPDVLAMFFTLNRQSIKGAAAVASSVSAAVRTSRGIDLPIYPVPTRVEVSERDKRDRATRFARRMFAPFLMHVQSNRVAPDLSHQAIYWDQVETLYESFYAYEEVPAAFKDDPGRVSGVLASTERLTRWMTKEAASRMGKLKDEDRNRVIAAYAFAEDESDRIEGALPIDPRPSMSRLLDTVRWQVSRHPWQYTTIAALGFLVLGLLALIQQRADLRAANTLSAQYKAVGLNTSVALDAITGELLTKLPDSANKDLANSLANRLKALSGSLRSVDQTCPNCQ